MNRNIVFAICASLYIFFLFVYQSLLFTPHASAQRRDLPKAGFPVLSRPSGQLAPASGGVHLNPGLDRPRNAPAQIYNPGEPSLNHALVRWEPKKMPIMIWISPGIKLPECSFDELQKIRVNQVFQMLQQQDPWLGLQQAPDWTEEVNYLVAAGFEQWREFENEGLFSFGFTDDPRKAHVLVFFTDSFQDTNTTGGNMIAGNTSAEIYPFELAQRIKIAQKPVIIELSTSVNSNEVRMRKAAAHEFGHALGIKAHSPFREDIMNVDEVVDQLSPSDKATIRWLYRKTPQFVM